MHLRQEKLYPSSEPLQQINKDIHHQETTHEGNEAILNHYRI